MTDAIEPAGEFILYTTEDGQTRIECHFQDETIWLSQKLMAEVFEMEVPTINEHLQNLFEEQELAPAEAHCIGAILVPELCLETLPGKLRFPNDSNAPATNAKVVENAHASQPLPVSR